MLKGTVKMINLKEGYKVYTRTVGTGIPILLLHGGPGANHLCFENFEDYIDLEKFALVYYDQLGSEFSDKITDKSLLTLERYVNEVEQVREGLGLDKFITLGHSWGGMLCVEYALKYQNEGHLIGTIISNSSASIEAEIKYLNKLRRDLLSKDEYDFLEKVEAQGREEIEVNYNEIVFSKLYPSFFCRLETYPDFFKMPNVPAKIVYEYFQGKNEFVMTGAMVGWNRRSDMKNIVVKALVIGAENDTMDPVDLIQMGEKLPNGESYICPNGSHFAFLDDSENYFKRLNLFLNTL